MRIKTVSGSALIGISGFMLFGFLNSSLSLTSTGVLPALLFVVVLPLLGGSYLLHDVYADNKRLKKNTSQIAAVTLEAEILKMATQQQGKLTALEVATEFAIAPEKAEKTLDQMALKKLADYEVTDSGLLVYHFKEVACLADKSLSKGILDDH